MRLPRRTLQAAGDDRISRLCQSLVRHRQEMEELLTIFLASGPVVRASIYELRRKCGKPSCACASGKTLHKSRVVSWSSSGRKHLRVLSPKEQLELPRLVEGHRRLRRSRARLVRLHSEMLEVIDQLEALRRRDP